MAELSIHVSCRYKWVKKPTDLSKCLSCGDVIYADMNALIILVTIGSKKSKEKSDMILCNSCLDCIPDKYK